MRSTKLVITAIMLGLMLGGCAQSKLHVQVDVYRDDPLAQALADPERLANIRTGLKRVPEVAVEVVTARKAIADSQLNIYLDYLALMEAINYPDNKADRGKLKNANSFKGLTVNKQAFFGYLDSQIVHLRKTSVKAQKALEEFAEVSKITVGDQSYDPAKFFTASDNLDSQLDAVDVIFKSILPMPAIEDSEEPGKHYEFAMQQSFEQVAIKIQSILVDPKKIGDFQSSIEKPTVKEELSNLKKTMDELDKKVKPMREAGVFIPNHSKAAAGALGKAIAGGKAVEIGSAMTEAIRAAQATSPTPGYSSEGQLIIRTLAGSTDFFTSQVDRMQDPADPAWRILSAPSNQHKWHTDFSKTEYYAEGDAEVVVVRDSVGHFRVQRGKNNPTATILSQAKITRSIASGTLDVLAAAAGVSGVPGLSGVANKLSDEAKPKAASDPSGSAQAAPEVVSAVRAEKIAKLRQGLRDSLVELRADIAKTPEKQDVKTEITERLKSTLESYQRVLDEMKEPAASK